MKKSPNITGLFLFIFVALIFSGFSTPPFMVDKSRDLLTNANLLNLKFPQEKIYLQFDRQTYLTDDDVWYKAYIKNSPVRSCNLYVELINSAGAVVHKNISWAYNGLAYGDFHLSDTLSGGMYQIRAYTSWMRNFDNAWFFRKNLLVINSRSGELMVDSVRLRKRNIDLQFFPEGGTFLANQNNRVAFKAVDENGNGIDLEGKIVNGAGEQVTEFKSLFKGIGSFEMVPKEGEKYSADVNVANRYNLKVALPEPQTYGVHFSVDATDSSSVFLQVSENYPKPKTGAGSKYLLAVQAGGMVCFSQEINLQGKSGHFEIDKNTLPGGIVKFTLFDQNALPHCERLVFNTVLDTLHIAISPEKAISKPREKVKLNIKATEKDGFPGLANLSMAVYHSNSEYKIEEYPDNIFTRFLFSSELRGTIEEPGYYFKDDSLPTRVALDNLMLTHGYRYFEWEEILEGKKPEIKFRPDSSIQIKGRVKSVFGGKPLADSKVSMISLKSLLSVYETTSDSLGEFTFSDLYFKDTVHFSIEAKTKRNKRSTVIELDESLNSPDVSYLPSMFKGYGENETRTYTYLSELSPELLMKKWHLSDTVMLGDINVVAKKNEKMDGRLKPYLEADHTVEVSKLEDNGADILESLRMNSAVARYFLDRGETDFFIDGVPARFDLPPMSWIEKVEFVKLAPLPGKGMGPAVFFYTKRGAPNEKTERLPGTLPVKLAGYSVFRKFYSPNYESGEVPKIKNDFRRTLYWNPIVRTDSNGLAQVTFYNSDETGKVNIVVEGLNAEGKLCRGVAGYSVDFQ